MPEANIHLKTILNSKSVVKMRLTWIVAFLFCGILAEELERDTRGLDSQGFKALIEIGRLINNIGVDNIESHIQGFVALVAKNIVIFYFLIFSAFLAHFVTFFFIMIAVRSRSLKYNLRTAEVETENLETNDFEYWPATPVTLNSETYI